MPNPKRMWVYSPPKPVRPTVSERVKSEVTKSATTLIDTILKPTHVRLPPTGDGAQFNYLTDIFTKWYRGYFYFCATYACPGPHAISPSFETKFARMEYLGQPNRFRLSFMRHTGEWVELYDDLPLDKCLKAIRTEAWFHP